jgi:glucosamine kinase
MNASALRQRLFIGVDGGGTGCRARIEDEDGRALGTGAAGPAAVRLGIDRSLAEVETACRAAITDAGLAPSTLADMDASVGLAGIGRKGVLDEIYVRPHPFRSVVYVNDANIACIGAHSGRDGGIVIIGTGSAGLALVQGREVQVGGYGFPVGDEGSGADLGLRAIRLALRACDGRIAATATDYATLAPLVMRHADTGDAVGRRIVRAAAVQVDAIVRRLIECGAPRVALAGGLAAPMEPWLAPDVQRRLSPVEGDAVAGALLLARRQRPAAAARRMG